MNEELHSVIVTVLGACSVAAIIAACTAVIRRTISADRINREIGKYVVPHFQPPTPEEIRQGAPDRTIPARIKSLESANAGIEAAMGRSAEAVGKVAQDLHEHLIAEEAAASKATQRETDRDEKIDLLMGNISSDWNGTERRAIIKNPRKKVPTKKIIPKKQFEDNNEQQI